MQLLSLCLACCCCFFPLSPAGLSPVLFFYCQFRGFGRKSLKWPLIVIACLHSCACVASLPYIWAGPSESCIKNSVWQMQWDFPSEIRLQRDLDLGLTFCLCYSDSHSYSCTSSEGSSFLYCDLPYIQKPTCHVAKRDLWSMTNKEL